MGQLAMIRIITSIATLQSLHLAFMVASDAFPVYHSALMYSVEICDFNIKSISFEFQCHIVILCHWFLCFMVDFRMIFYSLHYITIYQFTQVWRCSFFPIFFLYFFPIFYIFVYFLLAVLGVSFSQLTILYLLLSSLATL